MTSFVFCTTRSEYKAFMVCLIRPEEARYICRPIAVQQDIHEFDCGAPSMWNVFGKGGGSSTGGV
jgi:hypothetical protein